MCPLRKVIPPLNPPEKSKQARRLPVGSRFPGIKIIPIEHANNKKRYHENKILADSTCYYYDVID